MADEISITMGMQVSKNELDFKFDQETNTYDMSGTGGPTPGYITVGTSEESMAFPELGTLGWFFMKNLDSANYVQWGFSTGVYGGRIRAGETAGPFRLEPGATLYLKANTSSVKMLVYGFEN